jgi:hypothetical protein
MMAVAVLVLAARSAAAEDEVRIEARLEPAVIGIDETATLSFEARANGLENPRFRPDFELDNLDIVAGPYRAEDVSFVNGAISRSFRISFRVRPRTTGRARVRSIVLSLPGQTLEVDDREITVQEEPTGQEEEPAQQPGFSDPFERFFRGPFMQRRQPRGPAVFLRSEITPEHPYVGQQVLYTIHLYTRDDISAIMPRELPTFRGFWVRDIPLPSSATPDMVDVGGARYGRVVLLQKALFPLRPGRHQVEPAQVDLVARVIEQRFFGPPLSRPEQVRLSTAPQFVDVQPLPAAPPGFSGTVGQLGLAAKIEPVRLRLGEAATLTVTLSGRGNLQSVAEPRIAPPEGLTLYPPQQQSEDLTRGTTIAGERTWSYVVVPDRTGRYTLRVPEIPYFDPGTGAYRSAAAPALEVRALPRLSAAGAPHPVRSAALAQQNSLLAGTLGRLTPWAPWLFTLPWGIAFAVLLLARRRRPVAELEAPILAAHGDAVEQRLREAETESRPRQAAARIEEAWRELLAARWEIPSGTPPSRWGEALAARGAEPATAAELLRLAEDLHYLRYAPQLSETGGLVTEAVDRSRRLLRRLR